MRRLPHYSVYSIAEILLLTLLAIQLARLVWAVAAPVGPLGEWRLADRISGVTSGKAELFRSFDPFFRLQDGGTAVVTSLQLTLFGTRMDEVNGRGSAIIAGPDGVQNSFAVGDEVMPGVILKAVAFDSVSIDRGGALEQIFLDQSVPAPAAAELPPGGRLGGPPPPPSAAGQPVTADQIRTSIQFLPRAEKGRVTGLVLRPAGDPGVFINAGFRDGDILVAINGQPISSPDDAQRLAAQLKPGSNVSVNVERGSGVVPIAITIAK
ncbi:type II secretion system protein N [Sphingobium boeckii]|uniref:General secretion pathway protein C n=1 Tax=Sphingobium boeckii TaxID=1082345 RepID=A0A7W9EFL2_9SPHN|nr:general secretion pathway protein C [Sphingobium boeckii]